MTPPPPTTPYADISVKIFFLLSPQVNDDPALSTILTSTCNNAEWGDWGMGDYVHARDGEIPGVVVRILQGADSPGLLCQGYSPGQK